MQEKGGADVAKSGPPGKSGLADFHGMELALDVAAPEVEEPAQLGEFRGKIELLPDEALQQVGMIGKMVDDLCRGQPILTDFRLGVVHIASPPGSLSLSTRMPPRARAGNKKTSINNSLAAYSRGCCQPRHAHLFTRS